jgi:hypothetical protein
MLSNLTGRQKFQELIRNAGREGQRINEALQLDANE